MNLEYLKTVSIKCEEYRDFKAVLDFFKLNNLIIENYLIHYCYLNDSVISDSLSALMTVKKYPYLHYIDSINRISCNSEPRKEVISFKRFLQLSKIKARIPKWKQIYEK